MNALQLFKAEQVLHSLEWLAWLVLLISLALGLGVSVGAINSPEYPSARPSIDLVADTLLTVMVCASALTQLLVQVRHPTHGRRHERFARWLLLCASTIFAYRFASQMATVGDIFVPPITVAAFVAYSIAQITAGLGIIASEIDMPQRRAGD